MQTREREKESRDSIIVMLLILLFGFVCILLSSGWALRFAPNWWADSNMGSNLNPDSDFLTSRPVNFLEPLDPSILTDPAWIDAFLTPGATFSTRISPPTITNTPSATNTGTNIPVMSNSPTNTPVPTNTLIYFPPPSATTKPPPPPPPATATSPVPPPSADLQITKTDNATDYEAGGTTTYTIVVSNNGPSDVIGATVTDNIPTQISSWSWACTSQIGGATGCDAVAGSTTNFTDTVDLPNGASIIYTVSANISAGATGTLTNTANINAPVGITDPNSGNNSRTDTPSDALIVANPIPVNIGHLNPGSYADYTFGIPPLTVTGDPTYDLVYYPDPTAVPTLQVDAVILQIGDGRNWYTIFNWGNGSPDGNTDIPYPTCSSEADNCVINPALLTNSPGISINVDLPGVPVGNYPYIRIFSPSVPPDSGDGLDVNTITLLP